MEGSSNYEDTGKLSGYSKDDDKIKQMMETYTSADNDEYIKQIIEDFAIKEKPREGNPSGMILTKWNGERATRRFIASALQLKKGSQVEKWMDKNFEAKWNKYDVNNDCKISEGLLPLYFKSLVDDQTL